MLCGRWFVITRTGLRYNQNGNTNLQVHMNVTSLSVQWLHKYIVLKKGYSHVTLYSGLNYTGIHVKQYGPVDDYNMQVQIVFKYLNFPHKSVCLLEHSWYNSVKCVTAMLHGYTYYHVFLCFSFSIVNALA